MTVQPPPSTRVAVIDLGRAIAALAVLYVHVDGHFLREKYGALPFPAAVDGLSTGPLGLGPFGLGQIGVGVFFLISGFVVTPIALALGARRFAVNRFFRVFPLLAVVVLLSAAAVALELHPLASPEPPDVSAAQLLANFTLVNFFLEPFQAYVAVAWTLAVEVIFYLLLIAVLPLLRRRAWAGIAIEIALVVLIVLPQGQLGSGYDGIAALGTCLVIPITGQVLWAGMNRKIPAWLAGCYLAAGWGLVVWTADVDVEVYWEMGPAPVVLAFLLFAVGLGMEPRLRPRRFWAALSERSYSLYLVHGLVALPVLFALDEVLPLPLTLLLGLAATALAVQLSYVAVERPSHALGRRLSRRR